MTPVEQLCLTQRQLIFAADAAREVATDILADAEVYFGQGEDLRIETVRAADPHELKKRRPLPPGLPSSPSA